MYRFPYAELELFSTFTKQTKACIWECIYLFIYLGADAECETVDVFPKFLLG